MNLFLPVALWAAMASAEPDSKSEADLRRQLLSSQEEVVELKKELASTNAKLKEQLAVARAVPKQLSDKVQTLVQAHADEKTALEQTQAQSTQTLINTGASVQAQIEFEKQLTIVERSVAISNGNITKLVLINIFMLLLVLCFLGLLLYPNLWRQQSQRTGAVSNGGV